MPGPKLLAILDNQGIDGDDALFRLAQARLAEAGLGGELYPGDPEQLRRRLAYRPAGLPCTVHLPRNLNLLEPAARARVRDFAAAAAGTDGMIVHDHLLFGERPDEAAAAFRDMDRLLAEVAGAPMLFVEYAAGLDPARFAELFERTAPLPRVSVCVDISHVAIRVCQIEYARTHPNMDVCSLKHASDLPARLDGILAAAAAARAAAVELVGRLSQLGRPMHIHLHDGHPLSTLSRWGVSDHLGFTQQIRIPAERRGRRTVDGIFGPAGLREVIAAARSGPGGAERLSLMLEIHPQEGRTPLGPHAHLFHHWNDRTNAERMNHWLDALAANAVLLRDALAAAG